jgi:hypothetical protein
LNGEAGFGRHCPAPQPPADVGALPHPSTSVFQLGVEKVGVFWLGMQVPVT